MFTNPSEDLKAMPFKLKSCCRQFLTSMLRSKGLHAHLYPINGKINVLTNSSVRGVFISVNISTQNNPLVSAFINYHVGQQTVLLSLNTKNFTLIKFSLIHLATSLEKQSTTCCLNRLHQHNHCSTALLSAKNFRSFS